MPDAVMVLERIAARRAELNVFAEHLVKQLGEVRAERDELLVAERVVQRISEQGSGSTRRLRRRGGPGLLHRLGDGLQRFTDPRTGP